MIARIGKLLSKVTPQPAATSTGARCEEGKAPVIELLVELDDGRIVAVYMDRDEAAGVRDSLSRRIETAERWIDEGAVPHGRQEADYLTSRTPRAGGK